MSKRIVEYLREHGLVRRSLDLADALRVSDSSICGALGHLYRRGIAERVADGIRLLEPPPPPSEPSPASPCAESAPDEASPAPASSGRSARYAGPPALIHALHRRGIALWVEEGRLGFEPASKVTPEERELLRAHKPELMGLLRAGACLDS